MPRVSRLTVLAVLLLLATPGVALAVGEDGGFSAVHIGISLVGLVVAVFLLLEALNVRKVALGGVIADKIGYVVLSILCLATSALIEWAGNFVEAVTFTQLQLASEVLVVVAMVLLTAYFYSVRTAMQRYLKALTGTQMLAAEQAESGSEAPSTRKEGHSEGSDLG